MTQNHTGPLGNVTVFIRYYGPVWPTGATGPSGPTGPSGSVGPTGANALINKFINTLVECYRGTKYILSNWKHLNF